MTRWWRAYEGAVDDPPIVLLSDAGFRLWFNLRCLQTTRGGIPEDHVLPWCVRLKKKKFERLLAELMSFGLAARNLDGRLEVLRRPYENDRPPQAEWSEIRARIFERDDYTCAYCGSRGGKLQCDHIHPVSRGGGHSDENLATACEACNRAKAGKLLEDWLASQ